MIETIDYIHSNFIIVKDIKLDNILLKTNQAESDIMICDFNLSIILSKEYSLTGDRGGTLYYVAPEVLSSQTCYSYKSDIWSLGVCLYYLLGRQLPFWSQILIRASVGNLSSMVLYSMLLSSGKIPLMLPQK